MLQHKTANVNMHSRTRSHSLPMCTIVVFVAVFVVCLTRPIIVCNNVVPSYQKMCCTLVCFLFLFFALHLFLLLQHYSVQSFFLYCVLLRSKAQFLLFIVYQFCRIVVNKIGRKKKEEHHFNRMTTTCLNAVFLCFHSVLFIAWYFFVSSERVQDKHEEAG